MTQPDTRTATNSAIRVAQTTWLSAPTDTAIVQFATSGMPLPVAFRGAMVTHSLTPALPAPASLRRITSRLCGRLVVVNPVGAAWLGRPLADAACWLVKGVMDRSLFASRQTGHSATMLHPGAAAGAQPPLGITDLRTARSQRLARQLLDGAAPSVSDRLSWGVSRVALALYEFERAAIRIEKPGGGDAASPASILVDIRYRLGVIMSTTSSPPDWRELDAAAGAVPARPWPPDLWFETRRLIPDAWIASHADAQSLAEWARLTGRAGHPDAYWYPETWERFLEPGVLVGHLTPMDVWRSRPSGSVPLRGEADSVADARMWSASPFEVSPFNPAVERGVCPPPGYGLADCRGTLEVAIVAV